MQKELEFYENKFKHLFEKELLVEMQAHGNYMEIEAGGYLMRPGGYIRYVSFTNSTRNKRIRGL